MEAAENDSTSANGRPSNPGEAAARAGLREAVPEGRLASGGSVALGGIGEIARNRWLPGEAAFPPFKGHVVSLHLRGTARSETRLDDERWKGRQAPGDLEVFPFGKDVEREIDGPSEDLNLLLDDALVRRVAAEAGVDPDRVELLNRFDARDTQAERLLRSFLPELETGGLGGELYAEALANALALHLLRHHSSLGRKYARALEPERGGGLTRRALGLVAGYVDDNIAAKLSLEDLAAQANLSPRHFARAFKESTGLSPHRYVVHRRIERAKDLLLRGLSVGEVARRTGFADQSHLSRHFRRLTGVTPKAFPR